MMLLQVSAVFVLLLSNVSSVVPQDEIQKDLAVQDIESKIDTLEFFIVVFCDDVNEEECDDLAEEVNDLLKQSAEAFAGLEAALVNHQEIFKKYGVEHFPALIFFRKSNPYFYTDTQTDSASIYLWMEHHRLSHVLKLDDKNFEHDTQATTGSTTGDWFIMFYENHCCHLLSVWESVAGWLQHSKVVAKIELSANPVVKKRFGFKDCPTIALLSQGKMYIYKGDPTKLESLASFARSDFKKVEAQAIPPEPSSGLPFLSQIQMDSIIAKILLIGGVLLLALIIIIITISKRHKQRAKFE